MTLDLTSLFLSTININEVHKIEQTSLAKNNNSNYPPYNIIKLSETIFRISIALAGFTKNNVEILLESNVLIIRSINKKSVENLEYLYKGIANRAFEKKKCTFIRDKLFDPFLPDCFFFLFKTNS